MKSNPSILAYQREYRESHVEELKAYRKAKYDENKEKARSKRKRYYVENRDAVLESAKEYHKANREKLNKDHREYYHNNKEDRKKQQLGYRNEHREILNANAKVYRLQDYVKNRDRERDLMNKYGLTVDQFNKMLVDQNYCCSICGNTFGNTKTTKPHVDHNHKTGQTRELLCGKCNFGIGQFKDNPTLLIAAADYLKRMELLLNSNQKRNEEEI